MGDLATDCLAWWHGLHLGFQQSPCQLQITSPTLTRWHWAYLASQCSSFASMVFSVHRYHTDSQGWGAPNVYLTFHTASEL